MSDPKTMSVSASELDVEEMYLLLRDAVIPRPIAWVSSIDPQGRSNLAPFSFFSVCSADPPVLGFSVIGRGLDPASGQWRAKDTLTNIRTAREFVVNIAPQALLERLVQTSAAYAPGESEFDAAGLVQAPSLRVRPPRVAGAPVALECALHGIMEIGRDFWVMGRVLHAHLDERVYVGEKAGQRHRIDLLKDADMRPVGRLGRADYVRLEAVQTLMRRDGPNQ